MTIELIKAAAQASGFYDAPIYKDGPKPIYFELFEWSYNNHAKPILQFGVLKEELFNSIEKKIAYIQGIFEDLSEGSGIQSGNNFICFANSSNKVERCKKWINEISYDFIGLWGQAIIKHEILYTTPICHTIYLSPKIINYIRNYQFKELK